jgi:hypothetical protein
VSRRILGTIVCLLTARIDCFSLFFFKLKTAATSPPLSHASLCISGQPTTSKRDRHHFNHPPVMHAQTNIQGVAAAQGC